VYRDHSQEKRNGGKTRDGEKKYIKGSLPVATQHSLLHRAVRAEELQSCASTHKRTQMPTRDLMTALSLSLRFSKTKTGKKEKKISIKEKLEWYDDEKQREYDYEWVWLV